MVPPPPRRQGATGSSSGPDTNPPSTRQPNVARRLRPVGRELLKQTREARRNDDVDQATRVISLRSSPK
eukprot:13284896-Alexandrium_andersonii.AAC.1